MSIKWNPGLKKIKRGALLGQGYFGSVYAINDKTVLKITKMKDW